MVGFVVQGHIQWGKIKSNHIHLISYLHINQNHFILYTFVLFYFFPLLFLEVLFNVAYSYDFVVLKGYFFSQVSEKSVSPFQGF